MGIKKRKNKESIKIWLSEDLGKYSVSKTKEKLVECLKESDSYVFNLEDISECDTAGMQLLLSLSKTVKENGRSYKWEGRPESIVETAARIGLEINNIFMNKT